MPNNYMKSALGITSMPTVGKKGYEAMSKISELSPCMEGENVNTKLDREMGRVADEVKVKGQKL